MKKSKEKIEKERRDVIGRIIEILQEETGNVEHLILCMEVKRKSGKNNLIEAHFGDRIRVIGLLHVLGHKLIKNLPSWRK